MAKLQIPGASPLDTPGGISVSAPSHAIGPALDIGRQTLGLSQDMLRMGMDYTQKAQAATDEAVFQSASSKAMTELNQRVQDRINKPFNDDGTPNFNTLQTDIDKISQEVTSKYRTSIINPDVANKYNQAMTELSQRQTILAQSKMREQQQNYARGELQNFSQANLNLALNDDLSNLPLYLNQVSSSIDDAVKNGMLSYDDAQRMKEQQRKVFTTGKVGVIALQDPQGTLAMLNDKPTIDRLGLNEIELNQLRSVAQTKLKDQENMAARAQREQQALQNMARDQFTDQMARGVVANQVGLAEIQNSFLNQQIDRKQYDSLITTYAKHTGQSMQEAQTLAEISTDVKDGAVLYGKYEPKQINAAYKAQVQTLRRSDGQPVTLLDKANVVARYKAPVNAFTDEIKGTIWTADNPEQVKQAVQAYDTANTLNPMSVSGMDPKTVSMMGVLANDLYYTKGESTKQIIQQVRDKMSKLTPDDYGLLKQKAASEDKLKINQIDSLTREVFGNNTWYGEAEISNGTRERARQMVIDEYVQNGGNIQGAIKAVQYRTKGIIGESEVNGQRRIMEFPPENFMINKRTGQPLPTETITSQLQKSVSGIITADNPNIPTNTVKSWSGDTTSPTVSAKDVYLKSGDITRMTVSNPNASPMYEVMYNDKDGNPHNLLDKNGVPVVFTVDQNELDRQFQSQLDAAQTMHNNAMGVNPNTAAPGQSNMQGATQGTWKDEAKQMLQQFEGFSDKPYWDVNALRTGYGSDTTTDANGRVSKVTAGTRVSQADAERDLNRRIDEFSGTVKKQIGDSTFESLPDRAKAALTSVAYNYGSLPKSVVEAAKSGNTTRIADAVEGLRGHNGGVNSNRRLQEANLIRQLPPKADVSKVQDLASRNSPVSPMTLAGALLGADENSATRTLASFLSKGTGQSVDPRQVPWCAAFVSSILKASGKNSPNTLSARQFLAYGTPVQQPTKGDIVVLSRGNDQTKGHVGFVAGIKDGQVLVLGGNQDNRVSIKAFPLSNVLGYRRIDPDQVGPTQ